MSHLITGAAGFIGFHLAKALLEKGEAVVGIDNLNDYYDVNLKQARLDILKGYEQFQFGKIDISDDEALDHYLGDKHFTKIIHLAAQAGVRYSLENPRAYVRSNLVGHVNILEIRADEPVSLYAATKKSDELISHTYAHLYDIPLTGLRFFTVYGPWGRPDMAYFSFTKKILAGEEIEVFNHGDMLRDFTYIDDIIAGILAMLDNGPLPQQNAPHKVYNIGNNPLHMLILRKSKMIMDLNLKQTFKKASKSSLIGTITIKEIE